MEVAEFEERKADVREAGKERGRREREGWKGERGRRERERAGREKQT